MKRLFSIILCLAAIVSCRHASEPQAKSLVFDDLLDEYREIINYTSFNEKAKAKVLTLANDLYDVNHNTEPLDISTRLYCQIMGGDLLLNRLDYLQEDEELFHQVFDKIMAINYDWQIYDIEEGKCYMKEISYTVCKETDHEDMDYFLIIVKEGGEPQSYVQFPTNATLPPTVIFANKGDDLSYIDAESVVSLDYDESINAGPRYSLFFEGSQFLDHLKEYDFVFFNYTNTDGDFESAILPLDHFHQQLKEGVID